MNYIPMEHTEVENTRIEIARREERRRRLNAKRRRLIQRRRFAFCFVLTCILSVFIAGIFSFKSNALTEDAEMKYKYYTQITVSQGDTLWSIADTYMDDTMYSSKSEYIKELKSINHLNCFGDIQSGQEIIVPYYSSEFKL